MGFGLGWWAAQVLPELSVAAHFQEEETELPALQPQGCAIDAAGSQTLVQESTPTPTGIIQPSALREKTLAQASVSELRKALSDREEELYSKYIKPRFPGPVQSEEKQAANAREFFQDFRKSDGSSHWHGTTALEIRGARHDAELLFYFYDGRMNRSKSADLRTLDDETAVCWFYTLKVGAQPTNASSSCAGGSKRRGSTWWNVVQIHLGNLADEYPYLAFELPMNARTSGKLEVFSETLKRWVKGSSPISWEAISEEHYKRIESQWQSEEQPKAGIEPE